LVLEVVDKLMVATLYLEVLLQVVVLLPLALRLLGVLED
jgi:hypothetical protein